MGQTTPMVTFEIVGTSREQARDTAEQLVQRFSESITSLQTNVARADQITTTRLDRGTNIEESNSKVERALVAVAGPGC